MRLGNKASDQRMIQVVDDEFDIVNVIKLYLQERGLNVFGFTDPFLALECQGWMDLNLYQTDQVPLKHHQLPPKLQSLRKII